MTGAHLVKFVCTPLIILSTILPWAQASDIGPLPGQVIVDPNHPQWLKYHQGGPFFMAGPGDPEDFLYRGSQNSDGTRNGDQMALINKLKGTGANSIYLQAIRSHGGDGDSTHNPFIDNDPNNGINMAVLDQWETWFTEMDNSGIVVFFFFYDDSASVWNTDNRVGQAERDFIQTLVNRFEHHKHLIWAVAEEYQEAFTATRVSNIAAEIRAADDHNHPIAVHKLSGLTFSEFANDPNIDQFAIQYWAGSASEFHDGMVTAWNNAAGRYNLNMAEGGNLGRGATARKKLWASAMGGAYVMVLYDELDGIKKTPLGELQDQGRLVRFMESTNFNEMAPHDELKFGGTKYVLALPGDSYIAYASDLSGNIGLRNMTAGTYDFKWYDVANGTTVIQTNITVAADDQTWSKPTGIGNELAVYITRISGTANATPTANPQSVSVPHNTATAITLTYTDPDGPGPYTFAIVQWPTNGVLSGNGASWTYTPDTGFTGTDSFTFTVDDGLAMSSAATVSITTVQAEVNNPPVASNQSFTTSEDTSVIMSLVYSDSDGPGPYTVSIVTSPTNGTLSGVGNDCTYTPNPGFNGTDSFTWKANDSLRDSNVATVTIAVNHDSPVVDTIPPAAPTSLRVSSQ